MTIDTSKLPADCEVWTSGDCTLIRGDCLAVLPAVSGVDAVVTDPPYGVGFKYATHDDTRDGYQEWCRQWFALLNARTIAITCGQANVSDWSMIARPVWWLAWWKPAAMGRCVVGFNNWEPIALYGKAPKNVCDVIRATIKPDPDLAGHPCPKPLEWATKQIEMMTVEGETVLDPFAGSGTAGVASEILGRRFIGIEKDPSYFAIARDRIIKAQQAKAEQLVA